MSLCLLILAPAARAGYYATTYTGGGYNSYGTGGANAGYGNFLSQSGIPPLTDSLNSQITATFAWQPAYVGDAPPNAAVVSEDSQVGWNSGGSGSTGLSGGLIVSGGTLVPCRAGQNSLTLLQQTKNWVKTNPGTTFSVTCTPTATDTGTGSPNYNYCVVGVSVGYVAAATPAILSINLKGTTPDGNGNLDILVGQVCTASVVCTPAADLSGATYQWSDPGGTTLQSWTPGLAPVAAVWPSANASPSWYWNDLVGPTRTVQCVVTEGGTPTTLTKTVTEQVPMVNTPATAIQPGFVYINDNCPNKGGALFVYAGGPGMSVSATFSTPSPFGPGQMELVQTATPTDFYKTSDGKNHPDPISGLTGLDTSYPYAGSVQAEPTYATNDNPGIPLLSYMDSVGLYLTFSDWLLYQPPDAGNGRYFVPRKTYGWTVGKSVFQPDTGWADTGYTSYGSVTITPACTDTNQYPTWTQTLQGQSVPWPASP